MLIGAMGCAPPVASPPGARTPAGVELPCVTDLEGNDRAIVLEALDQAIALLKDEAYQSVVKWSFAEPSAVDQASDRYPAPHRYESDYLLTSVETALHSSISVQGRTAFWRATVGWDGYSTPQCGRVVQFAVHRIADRGVSLAAGTFHHELAHALGYRHDGNSRSGNECTVPYILGDLAEWAALRGTAGLKQWPPNPVVCDVVRGAINHWYQERAEDVVLDWKGTSFLQCSGGRCSEEP